MCALILANICLDFCAWGSKMRVVFKRLATRWRCYNLSYLFSQLRGKWIIYCDLYLAKYSQIRSPIFTQNYKLYKFSFIRFMKTLTAWIWIHLVEASGVQRAKCRVKGTFLYQEKIWTAGRNLFISGPKSEFRWGSGSKVMRSLRRRLSVWASCRSLTDSEHLELSTPWQFWNPPS